MTATGINATEQANLLGEPHHDGSELCVLERPDELGGSAVVRLRTARGAADRVLLRYGRDGELRTIEASVDQEDEHETWWRASFPVANPSTHYRWLLAGGDTGYAWVNGLGASRQEIGDSDDFVMTAGPTGPAWHLSSVVYQIFPDRFATSGAAADPPDWVVARPWDALPTTKRGATGPEWYGGDLRGIEQHLDHVEAAGANAIYLTPFFPAQSTHRYDAVTFDRVDPLLGGDEALRSLVRAAKARGMRLIGDLTLNHTGSRHEWFEAAQADERAPERTFYYFDPELPHGYETWMGVRSMPKLDWRSDELHERMATVVTRWLAEGLDGWRIDVANMAGRLGALDLNHEVARWARSTAEGALVLAEHSHDFRPDLDGTGWHAVMNYSGFLRPAWWWLRDEEFAKDVFSSAPAPAYDGETMVEVMRRFRSAVPWEATLQSWTLLDSHDTARFRTVTGSRERHLVGIGLQMTTPGVPLVFAGDELGLEGDYGEDARRTMPWDAPETWDRELFEAYRRLSELRRSSDALARGGIRYVHATADAVAYLRETRTEQLLCLAARASHAPIATPFTALETLYGEDARDGILPADGPAFHVWRING